MSAAVHTFAGALLPAAIAVIPPKHIARISPASAADSAGKVNSSKRVAAVVVTRSQVATFRTGARPALRLVNVISLTGKSNSGEVKVASKPGCVNPLSGFYI
jgi:hypothetical protein